MTLQTAVHSFSIGKIYSVYVLDNSLPDTTVSFTSGPVSFSRDEFTLDDGVQYDKPVVSGRR